MNHKVKFAIVLFILQFSNSHLIKLNAQYLSPQVVASAGGYQANANGSLSFTIGETSTQTLSSSGYKLTQGFQQPFDLNILNIKAFIQGYYISSGQMQDVLFNEGVYANPTNITDTITLELHSATFPFQMVFKTLTRIKQDGHASVRGLGIVGQSYYIVIKHRNTIETWSANPILLSNNTVYDFSTASTQAYADNQIEVEPGVWAFYSGDITQDMAIDAFDYIEMDPHITNGDFGYLSSDLNGDGSVDAFDYMVIAQNIMDGIGSATP